MAIVVLCVSALSASAEETWEPTDIHTVGVSSPEVWGPGSQLLEAAALRLIHYYQADISSSTITRCPFLLSCSHFAERAIADRGLVPGMVLFVDRFYYRENVAAYGLYQLVQSGTVLKIDDGGYVSP